MRMRTRRFGLCLVALVLAAGTLAATASANRFTPGSAGLGDPFFPLAGNGGYDVQKYTLKIDYDPATDRPISVEGSGSPGELVCTKPFPSQPLEFVGKDGWEKYRSSYFEKFGPGVWCQGDFIQRLQDTDGIVMLGRS